MPADASEESGDTSGELSSKGPKEKRILIKGSVPTIHCANKVPEKGEPSDRDRRRSKAVSAGQIQSFVCFQFSQLPIVFTSFIPISS